jgi:hypothetical protein
MAISPTGYAYEGFLTEMVCVGVQSMKLVVKINDEVGPFFNTHKGH